MGIKETLELLEGLKVVGVGTAGALKDGKISLDDLGYAVDIFKESAVLIEAVKDLNLVDDEMKDLDADETALVVKKVFEIVKAIKSASARA